MLRPVALSALLLCSLGCSGKPAGAVRQGDGSYHLACRGPLTDCLNRAERICREKGYSVASARDVRELLGHESGESQVEIRKSEAVIYCGASLPPAERPMIELRRETPITPEPTPPPAPPTAPTPPPARACVPGATQACVGPGGCSGGQACAEDGTRYEPCNCGAGG
jgi:hypothetical protein